MRRFALFVFLATAGCLFTRPIYIQADDLEGVTQAGAENGQSLFDQAQKCFNEKKFKKAKDLLNQVVSKHPLEKFIPQARLLLARLQEDFTVSTTEFKSLAAEYSNLPQGEEAQKDLGVRYYLADRYEEAAESYKEFLQDHPKSADLAEVRYWYGSSLLALDQNKESVEQFKKVIHDAPDSAWTPKATLGLGNAYFKMRKYQDAEKQYLRILDQYQLYDELNLVYLKLGETYEAEHRWKEAQAAFKSLMDRYPKAFEVAEARDQMRNLENEHPELSRFPDSQAPAASGSGNPANPSPNGNLTPLPSGSPSTQAPEAGTENPPAQYSPKPYHVQVGVYSKKFNVEKARKALRKAGFNAYLITVKQEDVPYTIYKVRVGSFSDKASAEKTARAVSKKIREKAIVVED